MATIKSPTESSSSSLFIITPEQKAKYEQQFKLLCPTGDYINGQQARELMLKSKLSSQILAHIWHLSDVDADGRMDINEFSIALHLIALKLKGVELPQTLPQSLRVLVEPPPPFAAFNNNNNNNNNENSPQQSKKITQPIIKSSSSNLSSPSSSSTSMEWSIPQSIKLKYTQIFNGHDKQRTGFLTGLQAKSILLETKLPQQLLAQIWNLSDVDVDGRLTCEEFVLAMYLVDKVKRKEKLPDKLPMDLLPPSYRRNINNDTSIIAAATTTSLSHSSSIDDDNDQMNKSSFEDKRRENYEKGQAELDRRRAALQEQERRQREERERKEREENLRKEKEKQEAERRKQEELELQRQKLLQQELEREEQKRRQQEVRELARKEMERQRQREMEQTQRTELLTKRSRLMEELQRIKSRRKVLILEHEQIDKNLVDLKKQQQQSRDRVVRYKTEIDGMRIKRDQILSKQQQIKTQMKSLTEKQLLIEQEKVRLASQLKSLITSSPETNGIINTNKIEQQLGSTTFSTILDGKKLQINQLKLQLERMQQEYEQKKQDIKNNLQELQRLKNRYQEKKLKAMKFAEQLELKKQEAEKVRDGKSQSKYAADSDIAWGQAVPTNFEWPQQNENNVIKDNKTTTTTATETTKRTKFRYRCLFEFEARNSDEISIKPGDYVMVDTSACSEEGWLSGENSQGKIGWFPKDYVVLDDDDVSNDLKQKQQSETTEITINKNDETTTAIATTIQRNAIALYDWQSNEDGHLSFKKDDRLRIHQQQDSWIFGDLLDSTNNQLVNSGWFPESYVYIENDENIVSSATTATSKQQQQYYISLFAFDSQEPGDLGFDVNELIKIEKQDGEWWTGVIVDRTTGKELPERRGIFPSNFVGPANDSDIPKISSETTNNQITATNNETNAKIHHPQLERKESESTTTAATDSPKLTKKSKAKKQQEIVQAVAAYQATGQEQLSLEIGQLIQVRKKTQTGWWEGELQAKGKKKQIGWFPASYVKPLGGAGGGGNQTTTNSTATTKQPNDEVEIERVQALYQFNAQRDDEISFDKDDVIRVLSKQDPTWWRGHNIRTNQIGLFPSNHVQLLSKSNNDDDNIKKESTIDSFFDPFNINNNSCPVDNNNSFVFNNNQNNQNNDNDKCTTITFPTTTTTTTSTFTSTLSVSTMNTNFTFNNNNNDNNNFFKDSNLFGNNDNESRNSSSINLKTTTTTSTTTPVISSFDDYFQTMVNSNNNNNTTATTTTTTNGNDLFFANFDDAFK